MNLKQIQKVLSLNKSQVKDNGQDLFKICGKIMQDKKQYKFI